MNKIKINLILGSLLFATSFGAWFVLKQSITVPQSSTWVVPIIFFTLVVVLLAVSIISIREMIVIELFILLSLALSLLFAPYISHAAMLLLAAYCLIIATTKIRRDLELNVKINLWKSLNVGKSYLIFGISLAIVSQYFFTIKNIQTVQSVPQFDMSGISKKIVGPMMAGINPKWKSLENENITVDQFILETQKQNQMDPTSSLNYEFGYEEELNKNPELKKQISDKTQEMFLLESRKQFSQMVGKDLRGNEPMNDIIVGFVNKKINEYFGPTGNRSTALPIILSLILLLTIVPIGSFLGFIWFLVVIGIFKLMVGAGLITIKTATVEKEYIG